MQTIMSYVTYDDLWKINSLNRRFYDQILPQAMADLQMPARLEKRIDLYDGKRFILTFSRRNLKQDCPFRLPKWIDHDKYYSKSTAEKDHENSPEIGKLFPCSGVVYDG